MSQQIQLEIITQEKPVLSQTVDKVSAPAVMGEVTILPGHIPLFTKLNDGIVKIYQGSQYQEFAILGGFMDVAPLSKVTIMSDSAINAIDANEAKAQMAMEKARQAMQSKQSEIDFKNAEISLRKAILELKVARRQKHSL